MRSRRRWQRSRPTVVNTPLDSITSSSRLIDERSKTPMATPLAGPRAFIVMGGDKAPPYSRRRSSGARDASDVTVANKHGVGLGLLSVFCRRIRRRTRAVSLPEPSLQPCPGPYPGLNGFATTERDCYFRWKCGGRGSSHHSQRWRLLPGSVGLRPARGRTAPIGLSGGAGNAPRARAGS